MRVLKHREGQTRPSSGALQLCHNNLILAVVLNSLLVLLEKHVLARVLPAFLESWIKDE